MSRAKCLPYPFVQAVQDLHLNDSLTMEPLLVPNDFDRNILACLVVVALCDLSE